MIPRSIQNILLSADGLVQVFDKLDAAMSRRELSTQSVNCFVRSIFMGFALAFVVYLTQ